MGISSNNSTFSPELSVIALVETVETIEKGTKKETMVTIKSDSQASYC